MRIETLRVRHPMGRFGLPAHAAVAVLFLAADKAAFITGANLALARGYAAQ
jgi:NAD(P)-dependent dehydrogenase (short-subunit alcohol dehydrogenase family)